MKKNHNIRSCIFIIIMFFIFLSGCIRKENKEKNKRAETKLENKKTILDTTCLSSILGEKVLDYTKDTSVSKYNDKIKLLSVEFVFESGDTLLLICGHEVMPVIGPQNKLKKYDYLGFCIFNGIPTLLYDNEKTFGKGFYNKSKLTNMKEFNYENFKEKINHEPRFSNPRWIYKIERNESLVFVKAIPRYKTLL